MSSRKLNWLSSTIQKNHTQIALLEKELAKFYQNNPDYYGDIDFTANNWINDYEAGYSQILSYKYP
jgi:hypothetical protein